MTPEILTGLALLTTVIGIGLFTAVRLTKK